MNTITDRKVISAYGNGGFRIGETRHDGSVIIFPVAVVRWQVQTMADVTPASLEAVVARANAIDILLLGCGIVSLPVPVNVRELLRHHGIAIDAMTTGAACRTWTILRSEERPVAAALIAV